MAPVGEREFHAEFAQRGAVVIKPPLQQGLIACDEDRFSRQAGQWNAEAREQGGLSDEEFVSQYAEAVPMDILVTHDRQRCPVQLHIGIQRRCDIHGGGHIFTERHAIEFGRALGQGGQQDGPLGETLGGRNLRLAFQQEILWNGEDMEVLEPLWLREEMAGKIKRMWNKYKED